MVFRTSHTISATLCCLCVAAGLAFADTPYGSHESSYGPSTPTPPNGADKSVGPDHRIEVNEEKSIAVITAHHKVVKELLAVLNERDAFGAPTVRTHLAAKTLVALDNRQVLPFLAQHITYSSGVAFYFSAQPVLETCPYVLPLIQFESLGANAVIAAVAQRRENTISELEWTLYGYVLVNIFGDDDRGRSAAIALIDRMEPESHGSANLAVLKERVRTAKKVLYR